MNKIKNRKYRKINRKIRKRSVGYVLNKVQKNNKKQNPLRDSVRK